MVFEPDTTTTAQSDSSDTQDDVDLVTKMDRLATALDPLVNFVTVVVQALTAYTLIKKI